ncbi:phosphatidic acid phosphatase type 2/haloperoxidase, partial [Radiomyces spectabilis]|uniref:phosphatidic acid phosphatase type 2/haloperoxidase n=1 Tax=Radiomyces spectabilis TaxID=64574 RepID=UPI002221221F
RSPRSQKLFITYAKDWVLVLVMTMVFFSIDVIPPFRREFSMTDSTLMHPYKTHEIIPVSVLLVICIVCPAIMIITIALGVRRSLHDCHNALLGRLFLALSMTIMTTVVIKVTVGRPRPDMLDRCQPPKDIPNPPLGLQNYTICTTDVNSYKMKDGFKSFPSGHSSFSFAGLGFLSYYLAGKMHLFDELGHTYKSFVFALPLLGALMIAISRVCDYRHHWQDVFVGGLLGASFAYFAYRQYYPSLSSNYCHEPYALRI